MNTLLVCAQCEKVNRVPLERARQAHPVCGNCKSELAWKNGVQEVSGSALSALIRASDQPVVVDFWAEWCGPCKAFAPTFQAASQELAGKLVFAKLNTEQFGLAAQSFGIRSIPTLIVFKNGMEVDRQSGAMPLAMLKEYLSRF